MSSRTSDLYRKRMDAKMTPDELIAEIFKVQQELHPDHDPGDLTIVIQDDTALVMVSQDSNYKFAEIEGEDAAAWLTRVQGTPGDSVQNALKTHLEAVRKGEQ